MNLKYLSYFIAIAESGSLSAAAERLGISQPTLSKYLAGLEDELKAELFSRRKKRLYLTAAGRIYFDASNRMLDIQRQTLHIIEQKLFGSDDVLVIGTSGTRGAVMLAKSYRSFMSRYPKTKLNIIELTSAQQREEILNNQISLSFGGIFNLDAPGISYIPLMQEELVLAVPVYHPLARLAGDDPKVLKSVDIELFQDAPFALANETTELGLCSKRLFLNAGFTPIVVYRSGITAMITSAAKAGMGIAVILASYAEPCPELVYFRIDSSPKMYLCALHKSNHVLTEAERYLVYLQVLAGEEKPGFVRDINEKTSDIISEFENVVNLPANEV